MIKAHRKRKPLTTEPEQAQPSFVDSTPQQPPQDLLKVIKSRIKRGKGIMEL